MNDQKEIIKQSFMANEKLGYLAAMRRGFDEMGERIGNEINVSEKLKTYAKEKKGKTIPGSLLVTKLSTLREWPINRKQKTIEEDLMEVQEEEVKEIKEMKEENDSQEIKNEFERAQEEQRKIEEKKKRDEEERLRLAKEKEEEERRKREEEEEKIKKMLEEQDDEDWDFL